YKGKEIAKPITPPSETASKEDNDPEQAWRDKDMQKNLALIAKYFKKIYKPTNNNLRTSSNSRNKNVDTTLRYKNDNQSGQFGNQRTMNVAGDRENRIFNLHQHHPLLHLFMLRKTNHNQAEEEHLQDDEFTNPFYTPVQEAVESSSHNIVKTIRKLATDPEMCIFALIVSTTEPKNIKEAMANSAWIEAMQEELYQFDRL
nr:retrovirus-related Pol polyprotein from transposon TNT 1-94 [Tanacetum cinerariifolium]